MVANIAGSLLFHYENSLKGRLFFIRWFQKRSLKCLRRTPLSLSAQAQTTLFAQHQKQEELSALLEKAGADVQVHWESFGHQLTRTEIEAAEKMVSVKILI